MNALTPGDMVAIAAPSSPFDKELLFQGISVLENMGFRVFIPDGIFETSSYLAGSDQHRADILSRLFADPRINAIFCARGGFGAMRMLPFLDTEIIRKNLKIFMGFSDITAILSFLYSECNIPVFHGPMIAKLSESHPKTLESVYVALTSEQTIDINIENGRTLKNGIGRGRIIGGNLSTLCHLLGTPFMPDFKKHILFLEDINEAPYRIDRMLTQMKFAGCFEEIAGLVLGYFTNCGDAEDIIGIVNHIFQDNDIPILWGLETGHGEPNLTIPFGIEAELDADHRTLRILR
ncbi:MAG: LD-carboxypeptidase [Desulfobacteraceae bacterium]|nr:LD-carboxypeptidase [Desulfobacteraceae bacterium]